MKRSFFMVVFGLMMICGFSQEGHSYYLEVNSNYDLAPVKTHSKFLSKKLSIKTTSEDFNRFLKDQTIYHFKQVFPKAKTKCARQLYQIRLADTTTIPEFINRQEVSRMTPLGHPDLRDSYPNDYFDTSGQPNKSLELIRAPQAWQITHGDSTITIGIVDRGFDKTHEDLQGKIVKEIPLKRLSKSDHGTAVASVLAANTNNGKGIASIGYNTSLVVTSGVYPLFEGLDSLSKVPGVKVIQCSWGKCNPRGKRMKKYDSIVRKVRDRGVLLIASAGNGLSQPCRKNQHDRRNGYRYPASFDYDNVISVTSVGIQYPVGHYDSIHLKTGWKDCHQNNVDTKDTTLTNQHTHNDKVNISAPGIGFTYAKKGNKYVKEGWGTSEAASFVSGTAGLMLAVNPDLNAQEIRKILLNTADDIYHIPCNQKFKGLLGSGRLNAFRAVLTAKCLAEPTYRSRLDLMVRDAKDDFGKEPYLGKNYGWSSPDIWVRQQNDGKVFHIDQSAQLIQSSTNYVYVRVTNRSRVSTDQAKLQLYWAKAKTPLIWPDSFRSNPEPDQRSSGGIIASQSIPSLKPGEETIIEFPWVDSYALKKDASLYLLTRIVSDEDVMAQEKTEPAVDYVIHNNNVAWKKVELTP